jgi:hypothetical protein
MNINAELFKPIIKLYSSSDPRVSFIRVINPRIFCNNGSKIAKKPNNIDVKSYNVNIAMTSRRDCALNDITFSCTSYINLNNLSNVFSRSFIKFIKSGAK